MRRVRKKIAKKYEILPVLPADNESQNSGKVETLMEVLAEVNISEGIKCRQILSGRLLGC